VVPSRTRRADDAPPVVDRALDGTPLYAPRGELLSEIDGSAVQCHLCGRWYRDLASAHVRWIHQLTASEYRELVGLRPRHPLQAPARSAAQAELMRHRIATEPQLRTAMAEGVTLERQRQLAASGSRLGTARADAFRTRREQRARALGYVSLEDFYRRRYRDQHARVDELAAELACAYSAVRGDLERFGLGPEGARSPRARAVTSLRHRRRPGWGSLPRPSRTAWQLTAVRRTRSGIGCRCRSVGACRPARSRVTRSPSSLG
jgi:hypothetical protein